MLYMMTSHLYLEVLLSESWYGYVSHKTIICCHLRWQQIMRKLFWISDL